MGTYDTEKRFSYKGFEVSRCILGNILENELDKNSVCKDFLHTAEDGKNYKTKYYNINKEEEIGNLIYTWIEKIKVD